LAQLTVPTFHQGPLQTDGLVEGQPLARTLSILFALAEVDGTQQSA
jgi:hypothetical protein